MDISTDKPARTIGGLIALQCLVAQLLARHPDATEIFERMERFTDGLEPTGEEPPEAFEVLADISGGARGMIDDVRSLADQARERLK